MKFRRINALLLACLTLALPLGGLLTLPATAAPGDLTPVRIVFGRDPNATVPSATVIRGSTVYVSASNTLYYDLKGDNEEALNISSGNEGQKGLFKVEGTKDLMTVKPILRAELDSGPGAKGDYTVSTNFKSFQSKGYASRIDDMGAGEWELKDAGADPLQWLTVQTNASLRLTYDKTRNTFLLGTGTNAATGLFSECSIQSVKLVQRGSATAEETFEIVLKMGAASGWPAGTPKAFTFKPQQQWEEGNPLDPDNPIVHYDIKDGSIYDITYNYLPSNALLLKVLDPQEVLEQLTSNCAEYDMTKNQYIKLTGANDTLRYLTSTMQLTTRTDMHGENITLEWEWIPDDARHESAIRFNYISQSRTDAIVSMEQEDVQGRLRVTATYVTEPIRKDVTGGMVQRDIPITIHGRGVPATMEQKAERVGGEPSERPLSGDLPNTTKELDVYRNTVPGYRKTEKPYQYTIQINMGDGNGLTKQFIIEPTGPATAVNTVVTIDGQEIQYTLGTPFDNTSNARVATVTFTALEQSNGLLGLKFRYFVADNNNALREEPLAERTMTLRVNDTSPSRVAELSALTLTDGATKDPVQGFTFSPQTREYTVEVPFATESVVLRPTPHDKSQVFMGFNIEYLNNVAQWVQPDERNRKELFDPLSADKLSDTKKGKWVINWPADGIIDEDFGNILPDNLDFSITGGRGAINPARAIPLKAGEPLRLTIRVRAQDPNVVESYVLTVLRHDPSTDATLSRLNLINPVDSSDHMTGFAPANQDYTITVPYQVEKLRPEWETTHIGAKGFQIDENSAQQSRVASVGKEVPIVYHEIYDDEHKPTEIKIEVKSEYDMNKPDGATEDYTRIYSVKVKRATPSRISTLSALTVTDRVGGNIAYTPAFHPDMVDGDYYELEVPYATAHLRVNATLTDANGSARLVGQNLDMPVPNGNPTEVIPLPRPGGAGDYYLMTIVVTAEDGTTQTAYPLRVYRQPAATETTLSSLVIADQDAKVIDYEFIPEQREYRISVPYEVQKVTFTPTATNPNVREITVDPPGRKVASGGTTSLIALEETSTFFTIEISPEDELAPSGAYKITLTRLPPSNDALLFDLKVSNLDQKGLQPVFAPKTTAYKGNVMENAKTVAVTATTSHAKATITIEGQRVVSGQASAPINLMTQRQTITVVVTAQDGKTTKTYTISLTNKNLIPKTDNPDLESLEVNYGSMTPRFRPSVTTYNVSVAEDTYSVELFPQPADPNAEMHVYLGSKEVGDRYGNYAEALEDGQNEFFITITSSDKSVTKEYTVNVYRNDEEMMRDLTPIDVESINFEASDTILVDITRYTRVPAEVFNRFMTYENKTIVFQGNDYSLQFKSGDFKRLVPNTEIYDLAMVYSTPDREAIEDIIFYENNGNDDLEPVYVYFRHHGALPAPAQFTLSLGGSYRNRDIYWHYYNDERDRIDYYGFAPTNSRGTFTTSIDHFSTYIITDRHRINGSENKTVDNENLNISVEVIKVNPSTGTRWGKRP